MMIDISKVSPLIVDLIERLGENDAIAVLKVYGGQLLYVPASKPTDKMVEKLGADLAAKLVAEYAFCQLSIPLGREIQRQQRNAEIVREYNLGKSRRSISLDFGISYQHVGKILRDAGTTIGSDLQSVA